MRKFTSLTMLAAALAGIGGAPARAESVQQEIMRLERESYAAIIAKDYAKMRRYMAADWVQQDNSDEKITRELMISRLQSGEFVPESVVFGPMNVDVFGDVAVVIGSEHEQFTFDGAHKDWHSNFLEVWARRDGRWVSVRAQEASRKYLPGDPISNPPTAGAASPDPAT